MVSPFSVGYFDDGLDHLRELGGLAEPRRGRAPFAERVLNLLRQTRQHRRQEDARGDRHAADPRLREFCATGNVMPAMPALVAE